MQGKNKSKETFCQKSRKGLVYSTAERIFLPRTHAQSMWPFSRHPVPVACDWLLSGNGCGGNSIRVASLAGQIFLHCYFPLLSLHLGSFFPSFSAFCFSFLGKRTFIYSLRYRSSVTIWLLREPNLSLCYHIGSPGSTEFCTTMIMHADYIALLW